jgi:carbon-monoxide dehydrogenase medium subunit
MFPAEFDYTVAKTLDEAVSLLAQHGDDARLLAGGHSLLPLMKLRLAQPRLLIDITRIPGLGYIKEDGEVIAIGATTTHYQVESSDLLRRRCPVLAEAAGLIGDPMVRNRGTIGGSLAHADPGADLPAVTVALGAEMVAVGGKGSRTIPAGSFFTDMYGTALQAGEVLTEIRVPAVIAAAYCKFPSPASRYALAGVAAVVRMDGVRIALASLALTGAGSVVTRLAGVEEALSSGSISAAVARAGEGWEALEDIHGSAEYRRHLASVMARRALEAAVARG